MMLSLNTHQLTVFLVAAETLNFTQAAQRLEISQPSVSQHIQALEEHFGLDLFLRSGRNLELSDAGLALIPLAREMVYLGTRLEETMASLKGDVHGHLIVGCSTVTGRYLLPRLLADYHRQFPQVRVTCNVVSQQTALEMLDEGRIHVMVASNPPFYPDLEFQKFSEEHVTLICNPSHPWSKRQSITVHELANGMFIMPEETSEIYLTLRNALENLNFSIYQIETLLTLGSPEAIALSVHEGLGSGFVPQLVVERLVPGKVNEVKVEGLDVHRDVFIGRNLRRPATNAQKAFWEFVLHSRMVQSQMDDTQRSDASVVPSS